MKKTLFLTLPFIVFVGCWDGEVEPSSTKINDFSGIAAAQAEAKAAEKMASVLATAQVTAEAEKEMLKLKSEAQAKAAADLASALAQANQIAATEKAKAEAAIAAAAAAEADRAAREEKLRLENKEETAKHLKTISSRTFHLQYANAEEVSQKINEAWSGDFGLDWKVTKVAQSFPESNAIMVTAPNEILNACAETIEKIDIPPLQVSVEARFVTLQNNVSHRLGIDWQMLDGMTGTLNVDGGYQEGNKDGISGSQRTSYIRATMGLTELAVTLSALEQTNEARVFSNPKVIVSSGRRATVDMTRKYPNVKIASRRSTAGDSTSLDLDMQLASIPGEDKMMFANEAFFSWGISLDVVPRIGTNGLINVEIIPTVSTQADWVESGTGDRDSDAKAGTISARYPVIDVQRLVTNFEIESGSTVVIGGLSQTIESQRDTGIPFLRDLWWIGPKLFGSKERVKEQNEIIIFVTVTQVEAKGMRRDVGLPNNAVLGKKYTEGIRREPGDRRRERSEGLKSLDIRSLEEQYSNPRRTNLTSQATWPGSNTPLPFTSEEKQVTTPSAEFPLNNRKDSIYIPSETPSENKNELGEEQQTKSANEK